MSAISTLYTRICHEVQCRANESSRIFLIYEARRYVHHGKERHIVPIFHVRAVEEGSPSTDEEVAQDESLQELGPPYAAPRYLITVRPHFSGLSPIK